MKVEKGKKSDIGLGRARIPRNNSQKLVPGDAIEIIGTRRTVGSVWFHGKPMHIQIDSVMRENAGVEIGDEVEIRKIQPPLAESITINPLRPEEPFGENAAAYASRGLSRRPIAEGDKIFIPGFFVSGKAIPFSVAATDPSGVVRVTRETEIRIVRE